MIYNQKYDQQSSVCLFTLIDVWVGSNVKNGGEDGCDDGGNDGGDDVGDDGDEDDGDEDYGSDFKH